MTERKATKILHGFLSGIGFSFAFVLVIAAALYISSALVPKQSENFKVSCGGCEKRPLAEFDRYEIAIKDASYQMKQDDI